MVENLNLTDEALVTVRWIQKEMGLEHPGQVVGLAIQVAEILIKKDYLRKNGKGGFVVVISPDRSNDDRWYKLMREFLHPDRGLF